MEASSRRCLWLCLLTATSWSTTTAATRGQSLQQVVLSNALDRPIWVGTPRGDHGRLFVVEAHTGRVRFLRHGQPGLTTFLDLSGKILNTGTEQGLLGLAFHPQYALNGHFYVNYTRSPDGWTVIERYTVSAANPDAADPTSGQTLLTVQQPKVFHNAGNLAFGPDGYLYVAFGDGGNWCLPQTGGALLGKMLRLDVDGGTPYAIPPSNPFVGNPAFRGEVWQLGLRNPWRFSFDRETGDLYIADVGANKREEISFAPASSTGGENFGWPILEGTVCGPQTTCFRPPPCNTPGMTAPLYDYDNPSMGRCVIGGFVYRGCAIPSLRGAYVFGDLNGKVWSFRRGAGGAVTDFTEWTSSVNPSSRAITSFGEDACGEIYFTDLSGRVSRIAPAAALPAIDLGFGKIGGNGLEPRFEVCGSMAVGQTAELNLRDAPASTATALFLSPSNNPTPLFFGTLVPVPVLLAPPFNTDASGRVQLVINGIPGPGVVFGQWIVLDGGAARGISLSNALQINVP